MYRNMVWSLVSRWNINKGVTSELNEYRIHLYTQLPVPVKCAWDLKIAQHQTCMKQLNI